jgi:hypothetical protein
MQPCRPTTRPRTTRRGVWFWLLVIGATMFMTLEPSLFLVTVAVGLSLLALFWILLLAGLLVGDAVAYATRHLSSVEDRNGPVAP